MAKRCPRTIDSGTLLSMKRFLLFFLAVPMSVYAQAVAPASAPVLVRPPPVMTPGYFPGSQGNPVYTPTGAGLPGERVPGTVAPPVPTSKGRILPREPDGAPGLWAADGARASAATRPDVFGIDLPYPDDAEHAERVVVDACAAKLSAVAYSSRHGAYLLGLPLNIRQCLAYSAFETCARTARDALAQTYRLRDALSVEVRNAPTVVLAHASALTDRYCRGTTIDPAARAAYQEVIDQWLKITETATPSGN